jgi:hypothetical protein
MATKRRSAYVEQAAHALIEAAVASFSYGVEIRAQIYEDLEELWGIWQGDDDEAGGDVGERPL